MRFRKLIPPMAIVLIPVLTLAVFGAAPEAPTPKSEPPKPTNDSVSRMRGCVEALTKNGEFYALFGAAAYYAGPNPGDDALRAAKEAMDLARTKMHGARDWTPPAEVEMDRVTLNDGTQVLGNLIGRSTEVVIIEVMGENGPEPEQFPVEQVKAVETVRVAAETAGAIATARSGNDFLSAAHASDFLMLLKSWGKLRMEFPQDDCAKTLNARLQAETFSGGAPTVEDLLRKAAGWAETVCPVCLGRKSVTCETCRGAGTVTVMVVCPACNGAPPATCERCGGAGKLTCAKCGGTGKFYDQYERVVVLDDDGNPVIDPVTHRVQTELRPIAGETCALCGGTGMMKCPDCKGAGKILCPRCGGKGEIPSVKPCPACAGKKTVPCPGCVGTGLRPGDAPAGTGARAK